MYTLPETITVHYAAELKEQLSEIVKKADKDNEVILDAQSVEDIDASGVQLLLSCYKAVVEKQAVLKIINKNVVFENMLQLSGASCLLNEEGSFNNE
ncbi:anti-anti-sigma factor [Desulfitispora alkaliphila]